MVTVDYIEATNRLKVAFPYDVRAIDAIKTISGRRFVPEHKGGPYWEIPANIRFARRLRDIFGESLRLTDAAASWGETQISREVDLRSLGGAADADLKILPTELPALADFISARTYQRADIAFAARANVINANQPGLGKTVETIGAITEAGLLNGAHLVVAPVTSLITVWQYEWTRWVDDIEVVVAQGGDRIEKLVYAMTSQDAIVLITGFDTVRRHLDYLSNVKWTTITIDEFHKAGLSNSQAKFAQEAFKLRAKRKFVLSGTPVGGKPVKLWSALHFIEPELYSSKWNWVREWLIASRNGWGGYDVGGIKPGAEDAFWNHLAPHLIRRTKDEVAPDLPPKSYVDVWCELSKRQGIQYAKFARDAEIRIEEQQLTATSILAEYTRLKQFANARCTLIPNPNPEERPKLIPTFDSPKLEAMLERLEERGISGDDPEGDQQVVISSQFYEMALCAHKFLESKGIPSIMLTGRTKPKDRDAIVQMFQRGEGPRVVILTTTAGGVSITLDRADSVHILDETWVPDDQEQLEDRIHRISRIHNVTVYKYRSRGTIEEYIMNVNFEKFNINRDILELRRKGVLHG